LQELGLGFCLFTGLKSREERSKQYFDTALDQDFSQGTDWEVANIDQQFGLASASGHVSQQQLLLLEEDNTRMAARREHEVRQIVKSIVDLNDIFKDLAQMVADQVITILYEPHYSRTY
jgi:syntaxin 16